MKLNKRAVFTSALDLLGATCLTVFGWFVWPPLAILVAGIALLAASREANR